MKALGWLLPLALTSFAWAQRPETNAIILIQHDAVSRAISPQAYNHDLWIRWPISSNPNGSNRLLSLVTGLDWNAPSADLSFTQSGHTFVSNNFAALTRTGILAARQALVGNAPTVVLKNDRGFVAAESLLLGLEGSKTVVPLPFKSEPPPGSLVVYSAASWADAEDVARRCTGRALILEYPPEPGQQVSAGWLQGIKGVPSPRSTRVDGLVPASEVFKMLTRPDAYEWREQSGSESPQRWMAAITASRLVQLTVVFLLALLAAFAALCSIATEKGNKFARLGIALALGLLPSLLVAGNAAMLTGLRAWDALPLFTYFALAMAFIPLHCLLRLLWPASHTLFPLALFTTTIALVADPLRTVMSPVFAAQPQVISPVATGVLISGLTASIALSMEGGLWCRLVGALPAFAMLFLGLFAHPWWAAFQPILVVPILAVLAGSGTLRLTFLVAFAAWPFLFQPWNGRLAWDVGGLLGRRADVQAINAAAQAEFLLSPAWLSLLAAVLLCILFGTRYLRHQIRRAFLTKPDVRALFWAALATASMGLREPFMLTSALIVLMAAFLVLLFDVAGTL